MLLTIYDRYGQKKAQVNADDNSTQTKEIQADNVLSLSFTLYEFVTLDVNDYVDFEGERYWLMERYHPTEKSSVEWAYDLKLYGVESLIKRFLVLKTVDNENEPVFTLTAPPREHLALIVQAINDGMGGITDYKVGAVTGTENVVMDYEGTYCDEALKQLAEKVGSEWWMEGQTLNLSRCEQGAEITLGYGKGLIGGIEKDTADNAKFYTRLFPIGSKRNINRDEYGYSRLQLPSKERYVDVNTDKYGIIHHYEANAFADIYPRRIGTVSSVRSTTRKDKEGNEYKIYYFKDNTLNFNPNDYEIGGLVKRVSFQEGSELAGLGNEEDGAYFFEVNYNKDTKEFEIITIWPYDDDIQLPNDTLTPKIGDKYILWNISMPYEYYALAEEEFLAAVEEYNAEHGRDVSRYKGSTDHVYVEENAVDLYLGRRVRLESKEYFPETGYRSSRITKITRKVNLPEQMDIEMSDALSTGTMAKIGSEITDVRNYAKSIAGSISLPDIIRSWDNTLPTDNNLFSARRSKQEFLHKNEPDRARKKIIFDEGIDLGDYDGENGGRLDGKGNADLLALVVREMLRSAKFVDGFTGEGYGLWIDETGLANLTLDKLTVRQVMTVFELLIQKVRSVGGQIVVSAANGKVKSAELTDGYYKIVFEQENTFKAGDLMRCATYSGVNSKGYWVEIASVEGDGVLVSEDEFEGVVPAEGDECVLFGSAKEKNRQNLISIAATEDGQPRIDVLDGISSKSLAGCTRARLGNLDGIKDDHFPLDHQPHGDGLYGDNVFLRGTFLLSTGEDVKTRFEVLEGVIRTSVEGLRQDFTEDKGFLNNVTFFDGMDKWSTEDEAVFFLVGNKWVWANNNVLTKKGNSASVTTDGGRTVVHIKNRYIKQSNGNLRSKPTFEPNANGELEAMPVYLSFFYRTAKEGTLKVAFENIDKTGFANFNSFDVEEVLPVSDGYKQYTCSGLWNGTGDFKLSFTGDIYLYMLVLSTDKVESLTYKYRTLFEQSEKLVNIAAQNFDKDGKVLKESGLMVRSDGAGIYTQDADGNLALIGTMVEVDTATGEKKSVIKLTSDNILLEGLITANGNFKVLLDGSIEAVNGKFTGEVNAESGRIGGFLIKDGSVVANGSVMDLGTEDLKVKFQAVSNQGKTVKMNGGIYEYAEVSYNIKYNENRRVTIPYASSGDFKNFHVVDVMDISYFNKFQSTNIGRYGYQYAMLGNGHLCLDGIIEGHCLDSITPFKANNQVYQLHLPKFCNRINVSTAYDNSIIILPDLTTMKTLIGCGFVREGGSVMFSFKLTLINAGSKKIYVAGNNTLNVDGSLPFSNTVYPTLYNGSGEHSSSGTGVYISPRIVRDFMLVYDGSNYCAYEMID